MPGSAYRGRVLISAVLNTVDEASTVATSLPDEERLQPGRRARELGNLMRLRLEALVSMRCEKRHFLRHLYIKTNILPRQARDKHRRKLKKRTVFPQGEAAYHPLEWSL
jgi:hypothetical protein